MKFKALLCMFFLATIAPQALANGVSDSDAIYIIRSMLNDNGIQVGTAQVADGRPNGGTKELVLSYKSTAVTPEELVTETARILGAFLAVVKNGWDCDGLYVVVGDTNDNVIGMWYCTKEWKEAYVDGRMTAEEILVNVLGTMY